MAVLGAYIIVQNGKCRKRNGNALKVGIFEMHNNHLVYRFSDIIHIPSSPARAMLFWNLSGHLLLGTLPMPLVLSWIEKWDTSWITFTPLE